MELFKKKKKESPTTSIYFVCDAGMGSSAMGASLLQKKVKKSHMGVTIKNCAIDQIPEDAIYLVSHKNFAHRIQKSHPNITYFALDGFMDDRGYDRIVEEIMQLKTRQKEHAILEKKNILLNCHARTSDEAIIAIGNVLHQGEYIENGYIQGMLNRDHSLTTYIGNDIAIPHGEYEVRDCVKKTGLAVMIYPEGISWAQANVRIVIGIAAKNDEHMPILANIADKLGTMNTVEQVIKGDVAFIHNLLTGDVQ